MFSGIGLRWARSAQFGYEISILSQVNVHCYEAVDLDAIIRVRNNFLYFLV